jgi:hypothetical protein
MTPRADWNDATSRSGDVYFDDGGIDARIDARDRPLQSQGILVVGNALGDSPACGLHIPDHCDHVVAE